MKRTYRTSELSREQLTQALNEKRVLWVHAGPRAFGSGDVWFTIGGPEDLDQTGPLQGVVYQEPISENEVPPRNSYDSEGEFWESHDSAEIALPCYEMTAEQRVRLKQAVALFMAELIEMLPFTIAAEAVPYGELLRLYARHPDPELVRRVAHCARETGFTRLLFDPEQRWEQEGQVEPVEPYLRKELPRTLVEYIQSDHIESTGATSTYEVMPAENWLWKTARRWITDTVWSVYLDEEISTSFLAEESRPSYFSNQRPPSRQKLTQRLHGQLAQMDGLQTAWFRQHSLATLVRKLKLLPILPAGLSELLEIAATWADEPKPEITMRGDSLAGEAIRMGGDTLFGLPFQLMTVDDPVEIASRTAEAARELARTRFRACTRGLEVRENAEREAGEKALDAMLETLGRYARTYTLEDRKPIGRYVDLLANGLNGWKAEPECWQIEDGVLHGVTSGTKALHYTYTEQPYENFHMKAEVKLIGANGGICFRVTPIGFDACSGYEVDVGEGGWGCLREEGGRGLLSRYDAAKANVLVHKDDWNSYWITADGRHIEVWLNGVKTVDIVDDQGASTGPIAFQLSPGDGRKTEVWFKHIYVNKIVRQQTTEQ